MQINQILDKLQFRSSSARKEIIIRRSPVRIRDWPPAFKSVRLIAGAFSFLRLVHGIQTLSRSWFLQLKPRYD
jgi:hypothetical protein